MTQCDEYKFNGDKINRYRGFVFSSLRPLSLYSFSSVSHKINSLFHFQELNPFCFSVHDSNDSRYYPSLVDRYFKIFPFSLNTIQRTTWNMKFSIPVSLNIHKLFYIFLNLTSIFCTYPRTRLITFNRSHMDTQNL